MECLDTARHVQTLVSLVLSNGPKYRKTLFASFPESPVALVSLFAPRAVTNVFWHAFAMHLEKGTCTRLKGHLVVQDLQTNRARVGPCSGFWHRTRTVDGLYQQVVAEIGRVAPLLQDHGLLQPKIVGHYYYEHKITFLRNTLYNFLS